jgi:membrane protein DedA with SNARE-associated domain
VAAIIDSYGLAAVCAVLFVKGAGVPVPVPGDLLLLATAAQAASGRVLLWQAFGAVLAAVVLGGVAQFVLARGSGRRLLYRVGRHVGLTTARLDRAAALVRRSGVLGIALLVLTPGVRAAAIPACGLASVPWRVFVPGLAIGSAIDVALHFALGFAGGRALAALVDPAAVPWVVLGVVLLLAAVGLVGWQLLRRRRRGRAAEPASVGAFQSWEQAACPVCLALGARLQPAPEVATGATTQAVWE